MKKVLIYIAAIAAAAFVAFSCTPQPEDHSHTDVVVKAPAMKITVAGITDFTATITIAPEDAANYYAYLIDENGTAEELDPASLYANKYSSVDNGLVKYTSETTSTTVELEDLKPNTTYQVYAVAGSTTGVVGVIANASFTTSDKGTPVPGTPSKKDNVITLPFSEPVSYDSSKPATVYYYAYNKAVIDKSDPKNPKLVDDGKVGEAKVDVKVNGSNATFTVTLDGTNPLPDGAYYTVGYPIGAFVDAVGNPCPARTHLTGLTSSGALGFGGLYNRMPIKPFALEDDPKKTTIAPTEEVFAFPVPEGREICMDNKNAKVSITVFKTGKGVSSTTVYDLEHNVTWAYSEASNAFTMCYPAGFDINGGDYMQFDISSDAVYDAYGNGNEAISHKYLYSFNYKLDDVYGTYSFSYSGKYCGDVETEGIIIAPREPFEDPEDEENYAKCNIAIYNLFGELPSCDDMDSFTNLNPTYYAAFNVDDGMVNVVYEANGVGVIEEYEWKNYVFVLEASARGNFNFFQPQVGTIELKDDLIVLCNSLGSWDTLYAGGTLTKMSNDYTLPGEASITPASVSTKKADKTIVFVDKDLKK